MRHSRRRTGSGLGHLIDRRSFLLGAAGLLAAPAFAEPKDAALEQALASSAFVYISPLRSDGRESRCHGEVWFAWLDGRVVITTSAQGWKARALRQGLGRARIWAGDFGRWRQLVGTDESFRQAPHADAVAEFSQDPALLERLLAEFERKYPQEIERWRGDMGEGFRTGRRALIRYRPEARG